jgi:hypothetical protein
MSAASPSLLFNVAGVAASGTLAVVATFKANGTGPVRLTIKNTGSHDLSAAQVLVGPDSSHLAVLDSSTFATLAAGAVAQLWIDRPVDTVVLKVTCASGTTLDIIASNTSYRP